MSTENQSTHTPGPWRMGRVQDPGNAAWYVTPQPKLLADVCVVEFDCDTARRIEEHEANARLIAAAPELLEVLEGIVTRKDPEGFLPEYDKARAAIAKAKGTK